MKALALQGPYLWMGLPNGIIRYDTRTTDRHEIFTARSTGGGLLSNGVYTIRIDPQQRVWVGTYGGGVSRFDGSSWVSFTPFGGGPVSYGAQWTRYPSGEGLGDLWVYDIAFDRDGVVEPKASNIVEPKASNIVEPKASNIVEPKASNIVEPKASNIVEPKASNINEGLWAATWKGASRFDGRSWRTFTVEDGLPDQWVYAIARERRFGQPTIWWFGTEGGVARYDGQNWRSYTHADGLGAAPESSRRRALGSISPAPYSYRSPSARHETPDPHHTGPGKEVAGVNPNYVLAIAIDRQNRKWFGTWGAGLSRFDGRRWTTYTRDTGLGGNFVHALQIDRRGNLWAATDGGISRFDGHRWITLMKRDGLIDDNVFSIAFDAAGNGWFGTWQGLSRLANAS